MDWKKFILVFLRNIILMVLFAACFLGAIGYLLAGVEGFRNGFFWGAALSFVGGLPAVATMMFAKIGGGYAQNITRYKFKEEANSKGDPDSEALDEGWQLKK